MKVYKIMRNKDRLFHTGSTSGHAFSTVGKVYTRRTDVMNALKWYSHGKALVDYEHGGVDLGRKKRDMTEYTVIEYNLSAPHMRCAKEFMETNRDDR